MLAYKHYSFDLWLTLIKSNPEFKLKRAQYFCAHFNRKGKSLEEVNYIFRTVDLMCNSINEKTGKNIDADEMYLMVISMINENTLPLSEVDIDTIYAELEILLFNHQPVLYGAETIPVLENLKQRAAATMSILSNTGFIKGSTLRKVLSNLELSPYFDFQLYSDEEGMSKPNAAFFKLMLKMVREKRKVQHIALRDIVHTGDNPAADIEGANAIGISGFLVNSNNIPLSNLIG